MKRFLYGILAFSALAFAACTAEELPAPGTDPKPEAPEQAIAGELLVKFAPYVSDILDARPATTRSGEVNTRSGILPVDQVLDILGAYQVDRVFPVNNRTETKSREAGLHLWYVVRFNANESIEDAAAKLSALGEVQRVEFNRTIQRAYNANKKGAPLRRETLDALERMATRATELDYPFNDPLLPKQWHLINRGDMFPGKSIAGADVQCEQAWKLSTGHESIIVAVLDEGIALDHPDLKDNLWVNEREIFASPNDNDGNGYIGDRYGFNFVSSSGQVTWDDVLDTGHGTHVAGVIAARNGNGMGISSVAGGSATKTGVKIMSCQIFSGNKGVSTLGQVRAIKYAADNGAVILQCSWGYASGLASAYDNNPGFISEEQWIENCPLEKTTLDYFTHHAGSPNGVIDGGIAVFAAGNEDAAMAGFPGAGVDYVSVAATAADYTPAVYTNYGPGTTISAPGGDQDYYYEYQGPGGQWGEPGIVLSTLPLTVSETGYGYMEGTSMACPHVSGVVALALSYAAENRRHFKASEVRELIHKSVTPIDDYMTGTKTYSRYVSDLGPGHYMTRPLAGYKGKMGSGQINAQMLLANMGAAGLDLLFPNIYAPLYDDAKKNHIAVIPANFFVGGENLTYTFSIADTSVASYTQENGKVFFKGLKLGVTTAKVTASNGKEHQFNITVRKNANGNGWL